MTIRSKALSLVNVHARIAPEPTAKMAVVDDSADVAVTAPAATAEIERSRSSQPDAREEPSERMAGITLSAARWAVRLSALLAGLVCWHYASSKGLTLYVRFEQIPGPLKVGEALINQLQHVAFYGATTALVHLITRPALELGRGRPDERPRHPAARGSR